MQHIVAKERIMKNRLSGMQVFAQVVEAKSFSAAADKLGMSKSVASRHVSALERELSVKLLNRSTRKLSLTEAGAVFYGHCASIVQEAELAEQRVTQTQAEPGGLVSMTTIQTFGVTHLIPALGEFHRRYTKIRVKLSCSNRTLDLGDERFDLGVRVSFDPDPNLVARKLAGNPSMVCAAPSYLERRGTPRRIEDLAKHEWVLFPPVTPKGIATLHRDGKKYPVPVSGALETDDMDVVRAAVTAGLGIGILPIYLVEEQLKQGQLVPLFRQYRAAPESGIYLVYFPNRTLPSRVRALIDFLTTWFAARPAPETL
jgi:DNA-binding transcriptional LysR family regulator